MEATIKYNLLEMVQLILSSLDSDEVNSYDDTVESNQVALLLKSVYYDMASELNLPSSNETFELEASGDVNKPCLMIMPSNVIELTAVNYDNMLSTESYSNYLEVKPMSFDDFLEMQTPLRDQTTNVGEQDITVNSETFEVMYKSNKMPQYYTVIDDDQLLFDSYDSDEDSTLQKSKTWAWGKVYPSWTFSDTFTPELNPQLFSLYINRAKTRAFAELKQSANRESASVARKLEIVAQKDKRRATVQTELQKNPRQYGR